MAARDPTRRSWTARLAAAAAALLSASPAAAGEARTSLFADAIGRYGPLGISVSAGVARRWTRDDGPSPLARGRYAQLSATLGVNPAWTQGSLTAEWVPIAPLQVYVQYDAFAFFGAYGSLLRLPSADSGFGSEEIEALRGREQAGVGHRVLLTPVLRAKVGRLVVRSQTDLAWYRLSATAGWYYESEYVTILSENDWLLANRTAVMVELWRGEGTATLLAGPMYDVTRAGAARIVRQRAGAAAFWSPAARWLGIDRPRVYALAGVHLSDRNLQGKPFAVIGLGGDLDIGGR
ncbi:MAG TPA: hypothetical protein VLT61_03635 [Anaeromyxobacteraceae bacterium]|nr:hypothetical protein [Anaeromyxobacteraceae bacterium]